MGKPKAPSNSPHASRLARLRSVLGGAGVDQLLVTNPIDVGYLTGFLGGDSYLLVGPERPVVISDFRYQEELEPVKPIAEVYIRRKGMLDAVADVLAQHPAPRTGVQAEAMTLADRDALSKMAGAGRLVATSGLVGGLRIKKDAHELSLIRKAIRIQEEALEAVLPVIRKRVRKEKKTTELDVAAWLEAEMKSRGSAQPGFNSIVAARANGSLPHYRPGKVGVARNSPLLIDWGATYSGYHGDMTRVFVVGKWPRKIAEIYEIVLEAQTAAAKALAPGRTTHEVDAVARRIIAEQGYGEQFGHGLGHGMGLNGHEDPRLNTMFAPMTLEPGHVVTVEPGIYLPGVGGVRIEDDYVVTEKGAENLCSMPKDLDWATLS